MGTAQRKKLLSEIFFSKASNGVKLIFVTRKIDKNDPLTGFIFGWIRELAKKIDTLYVICQEKGDASSLPSNVEVHSFGKEKGYGKIRQGFSLLVLSFAFAKKADGFFVHMHSVYLILVSLAAKIFRRRLVFWYAHGHVDLKLKLAVSLADRIVSSSREGFRLKTDKLRLIGQAIDTEMFSPAEKRAAGQESLKILSLGRISPVKRLDLFIEALARFTRDHPGKAFSAIIAGKPALPHHIAYLESLKRQVHEAGLGDRVIFLGPVPHAETVKLFREHDLFVNLSETGSLDKAVLEAMAAGCLVLTSNEAYRAMLPPETYISKPDPEKIAEQIWALSVAPGEAVTGYRQLLRQAVIDHHSLPGFMQKLLEEFK